MDPTIIKQLGLQSCSADNIRILRGEVMRLEGIRAMIWANIRETERSRSGASLVNHTLFALQMIKATCDVVLGVAGEFVPAAGVVGSAYSAVSPNAENYGKVLAGQTVTGGDFAKGAAAGLNEVIKDRLGGDSPLANLSDLTKIKTDIVINATALDEKAVLASLVDYGVVLSTWMVKAAGKEMMGKAIKTADEVRKAGLAYHAAIQEWKEGDMDATFDAGIALAHRQMGTITNQIITLEVHLAKCGAELPRFAPSAIDLLKSNPRGPAFRPAR